MNDDELKNWERIKEHFETLPEDERANMFYTRACKIVAGEPDPLKLE
jgi:hypothetical protein